MLQINCDIGERGIAHPIDDQLMPLINIANIACGGHAGNRDSIAYYQNLASKYGVEITAHLSYPDRVNFGRIKMTISSAELLDSLSEQYGLLPCGKIKFHGALYHEANNNEIVATALFNWLNDNNINTIIAPNAGVLSNLCANHGIQVLSEGFIERGYEIVDDKIQLIPRGQSGAELETVLHAYEQYCQLETGVIMIAGIAFALNVATACIHSDSSIALELAQLIYTKHCGGLFDNI